MAQQLTTTTDLTESQERIEFMHSLNAFNLESGKPPMKLPIMGYKELDLFAFFKEVLSFGGYHQVTNTVGTWSKIWKRLVNYDPSITDASFRLKRNYERFLVDYEYKLFPHHKLNGHKSSKYKTSQKLTPTPTPTPTSTPATSMHTLSSSTSPSKKSKKSPNPCREIARDASGAPKMPLLLGEITIETLGTVINRLPYVTDKHIYPVGFRSSRYFSSMINPSIRVKYTSEIIDSGSKPEFVVTAEDDPEHPIVSHSPSGAWRIILKKVMPKEDSRTNISVSGRVRYGLAHPTTVALLREMASGHFYTPSSSVSSTPSPSSPISALSSPPSSPLPSFSALQSSSTLSSSLPTKRKREDLQPIQLASIVSSNSKPILPSFKDLETQLCASSLLMLENFPINKKIKLAPIEEDEESAVQTLNAFRSFCPLIY